jgi:choline dehydrogenase-like flavoprotein
VKSSRLRFVPRELRSLTASSRIAGLLSNDPFAPTSPKVVGDPDDTVDCDIAIVGSGVGGATLAWALRDCGARVLVLERGDFLPREWQNWSPRAIHHESRYRNSDPWIGPDGDVAIPGNYHYVGGSSKLYGATMPRFRETDFGTVKTQDGISPAWPVSYAEMEPFYASAEELYWVHGDDSDPTAPWRSSAYPFGPLIHEKPIAKISQRLARQGLKPFTLPQAVDWRDGGRCVLCRTCDAYACILDAKGDADVCAMRPALESATVRLMTNADVRTVSASENGSTITHLDVVHGHRRVKVKAARYVVSAGAVNTAALLLRSRTRALPDGIANSSGMVGRNYMAHPTSFIVGVRPGRENRLVFQKTLGVNDWYHAGPDTPFPLGNVQALGKLQGWTIKSQRKAIPHAVLDWMTQRSVDFLAESEDLPLRDSRVTVDDAGRVHLGWIPTNVAAHEELVRRTARAIRRCGYPLIFTQRLPWSASSHQCGTATMGEDPEQTVVSRDCKAHDLDNLWIVDSSTFPSSAAVNPALTVAANALRVADVGELTR